MVASIQSEKRIRRLLVRRSRKRRKIPARTCVERIRNYGVVKRGGEFIAQLRRTLRLFLVTTSDDSAGRRRKRDRVRKKTKIEEESEGEKERRWQRRLCVRR